MALVEQTLFGEVDKVKIAIARIKEFEPEDGYWIGDSFGKDSSVIIDLAEQSGVKYECHHALTTVDPPELIHFGKKHHPNTIIDKPFATMWDIIVAHGTPPTRTMRYCCKELKEGGG